MNPAGLWCAIIGDPCPYAPYIDHERFAELDRLIAMEEAEPKEFRRKKRCGNPNLRNAKAEAEFAEFCKQVMALRAEGLKGKEIAQRLGRPAMAVSKALRRCGVKPYEKRY